MAKKLKISQDLLQKITKEAVRCYPEAGGGLLLGWITDVREAREFVPCPNIQTDLRRKDPAHFPGTAKNMYVMDALEQEKIENMAEQRALDVLAVIHTHVDQGAYFSKEDKENAAPGGEPLRPDCSFFVISVVAGQICAMSDYYWDEGEQDYIEERML